MYGKSDHYLKILEEQKKTKQSIKQYYLIFESFKVQLSGKDKKYILPPSKTRRDI